MPPKRRLHHAAGATVILPGLLNTDPGFTGINTPHIRSETPFELEFKNCPPHMTGIHYRLEASGIPPDPSLGLLPLTNAGQPGATSGIAVQMVEDTLAKTRGITTHARTAQGRHVLPCHLSVKGDDISDSIALRDVASDGSAP